MATESFTNLQWMSGDRVIIAMKGLPCTQKTVVAEQIGIWAKLPMLGIDDFIGAPNDNNIADESWKEAERLQVSLLEQAFATLCRVAKTQVGAYFGFRCTVIKSRLSSTLELDQLFKVLNSMRSRNGTLLIVECRVRNKHQWQNSFNEFNYADADYEYKREWNRPRRWNDIEKAIADHSHPQSLADWDSHLQLLIQQHPSILVKRLVVDPHYDLGLPATWRSINPIFAHAINHLISAKGNHQNPYVVEFDELRRSRANEVLNSLAPSKRSEHLCESDGCLFKYREELQVDEDGCWCAVCEQKVVSGQPGYTCHYCVLTLHKLCAELIHLDNPTIERIYGDLPLCARSSLSVSEKHSCNSYLQKFEGDFDQMFIFPMGLEGCVLLAVVDHYDQHPHPLSLRIRPLIFICKACGVYAWSSSYVCRICKWYYHLQCPLMPRELKHGHGGHEHVLELKYSHQNKEQEDYWCDVCFKDLDPYYWYYSCPSCPYYAAHLSCAGLYGGLYPHQYLN